MIEITPTDIQFPDEGFERQTRAEDIFGLPFFKTVTSVPTKAPFDIRDQIVIINSPPGTYQLYIYETVSGVWKAVALT